MELLGIIYLLMIIAAINAHQKVPRVGIVGGGIGGCSTAFFLRQLFGQNDISIDIFEFNKIGGRLATERMKDDDYEIGGSVIHPRNKYMVDFVEYFGLNKRQNDENFSFGLYDGKEFAFSENGAAWPIWNVMKLLWRYGYEPIKLKYFIEDMLQHFSTIYELQRKGISFETVEEMLSDMNKQFVQYLKTSSKDGFSESGFSNRLINELILATLLVNYGQTTDIHQFVGAVSVAGGTPGLWAVEGGNHLVAEKLLAISNASLISGRVSNVSLTFDEKVQIAYVDQKQNVKYKTVDIVVLALPLAENTVPKIEFSNFPISFSFLGKYHQTVCTILKGVLNSNFFGPEAHDIQEIFSINSNLFFNSVGRICPVSSHKSCQNTTVWKVFSQNPLSKNKLNELFSNIEEIKTIPWLAYPHYDSKNKPRSFVLHKNVYHVNAIEWAASAMEMSVIGAKNVALLVHKGWFNISSNPKQQSTKTEL